LSNPFSVTLRNNFFRIIVRVKISIISFPINSKFKAFYLGCGVHLKVHRKKSGNYFNQLIAALKYYIEIKTKSNTFAISS